MDSLYKLRPHQQIGLDMLRDSFRRGLTRPMFYASVAFGKTCMMAHITKAALDKGKRVLIIVPYGSLIEQTSRSFIAQGIPQAGIIQASHEHTNSKKRLQIATIQSLSRRGFPETDLILADESHVLYKSFIDLMERVETPVIGFSGSPFTKGLGKYYNNLINPISMQELIDQNYLSEYIAYAPCEPNMQGVKIIKGDYAEKETGERMSTPQITGSITETWLKLGNDEPTICFAVCVSHANHVGSAFTKLGITNVVITARTPMEEREELFVKFAKREITILINVGTLVAGFDADVRCIIYARPTKSKIRWVQCIGRGLRTANGKEQLILLDHSGSLEQLGFVEDINIDELDDGTKNEASIRKEKEKVVKLPKKCPSCNYVKPIGEHTCSKCNFAPRITADVEVLEGELKQIKGKLKRADKKQIYAELLGYKIAQQWVGKTVSFGYLAHIYRDMTGVWPVNMSDDSAEPSPSTLAFILHKKIAYAKSRK